MLVIAVAGIIFFVRGRSAGSGLAGGVFTDKPQAPEFSLKDQNAETVTMSQLKGKVVALTFLYTKCPDVCPLIASNLAAGEQRLGTNTKNVEVVAVSVDPINDTVPAVKKFTDDHNLAGQPNWHYLIGSAGQLQPVWQEYHIGATSSSEGAIQGVDHSALVYLTDTSGKLRVILSANFTVSDFVQDVQALLKGT